MYVEEPGINPTSVPVTTTTREPDHYPWVDGAITVNKAAILTETAGFRDREMFQIVSMITVTMTRKLKKWKVAHRTHLFSAPTIKQQAEQMLQT